MNTITIPVRKNGSPAAHPEKTARAPAQSPAPPSRTNLTLTDERIRVRAYEIYEARRNGGILGDDRSDWLQAERDVNGAAVPPARSASAPPANPARGEVLLHGEG